LKKQLNELINIIFIISQFYRCKCFLTNNYFLSKYKIHVKYIDDNQLWSDFGERLESLGCDNDIKRSEVLTVIKTELNRRQNLDIESEKRQKYIRDNYTPLHKQIYSLKESHFDPVFLNLVNRCKSGDSLDQVLPLISTISADKRIYQFPVFTNDFCEKLIEEIDNFNESPMPKSRPNTMNNYGMIFSNSYESKNLRIA